VVRVDEEKVAGSVLAKTRINALEVERVEK
jgi:hypothetical protein